MRYYGSVKLTQFLIKHNSQIEDPNRLRVDQAVKIPPRPSEEALSQPQGPVRSVAGPTANSQSLSPRTYRVQPGDSFYQIARDVLGDESRWKELFTLNQELVDGDPTRLQIGQVIVLPPR